MVPVFARTGSDARLQVVRCLASFSLIHTHTHTHPQGANLPNTDPASLTANTAGDQILSRLTHRHKLQHTHIMFYYLIPLQLSLEDHYSCIKTHFGEDVLFQLQLI